MHARTPLHRLPVYCVPARRNILRQRIFTLRAQHQFVLAVFCFLLLSAFDFCFYYLARKQHKNTHNLLFLNISTNCHARAPRAPLILHGSVSTALAICMLLCCRPAKRTNKPTENKNKKLRGFVCVLRVFLHVLVMCYLCSTYFTCFFQ